MDEMAGRRKPKKGREQWLRRKEENDRSLGKVASQEIGG